MREMTRIIAHYGYLNTGTLNNANYNLSISILHDIKYRLDKLSSNLSRMHNPAFNSSITLYIEYTAVNNDNIDNIINLYTDFIGNSFIYLTSCGTDYNDLTILHGEYWGRWPHATRSPNQTHNQLCIFKENLKVYENYCPLPDGWHRINTYYYNHCYYNSLWCIYFDGRNNPDPIDISKYSVNTPYGWFKNLTLIVFTVLSKW